MGYCSYDYNYFYHETYQCDGGYNYAYHQCCNLAMYRFWNTVIWITIFFFCCCLCSLMT